MTKRVRGAISVAVAALLAAGPALETPLATVTGRIVGAGEGAYAYPLGRPDLKAALAEDGTYRIEGVPTSITAFILFDGGPSPTGRAERVEQEIRGGEVNRLADRYGSGAVVDDALRMPLAGAVVAGALPEGGATAVGPSFSVVGTDHVGLVAAPGESALEIYPLPAGSFEVAVTLGGFVGEGATVQVAAGLTVAVPVRLDVDADADAPGCGHALACDNGLHCNTDDGRCYACTSAAECGADETCVSSEWLCQPPPGTAVGAVCSACTGGGGGGADCASGVCVVPNDAPSGYCSLGCATESDCPAGFECTDSRCEAPDGCTAWLQAMGAPCVADEDCSDELANGWCEPLPGASGRCTAACAVDDDCRIGSGAASGFVCRPGGRLGSYCAL